jgi:hypothetical protein
VGPGKKGDNINQATVDGTCIKIALMNIYTSAFFPCSTPFAFFIIVRWAEKAGA